MEYLREQKNRAQHTSSEATARFSLNACCEFWECKSGVVIFWHITMRPRRECSNIDSHMLVQLLLRVFFGFFLLLQLSAQTFEYKMNIYCKEKRTGRPHSIWTFFFFNFQKWISVLFTLIIMGGMQHISNVWQQMWPNNDFQMDQSLFFSWYGKIWTQRKQRDKM